VKANVNAYVKKMLETWEEMPPYFITSSEKARGRDEVLDYIEQINKTL
jgi:GTP-binding protein